MIMRCMTSLSLQHHLCVHSFRFHMMVLQFDILLCFVKSHMIDNHVVFFLGVG
jgi:hypothetical protein